MHKIKSDKYTLSSFLCRALFLNLSVQILAVYFGKNSMIHAEFAKMKLQHVDIFLVFLYFIAWEFCFHVAVFDL